MNIRQYQPTDRQACLELFESNCPKFLDPSERAGFELLLNGLDAGIITYDDAETVYYYVLTEGEAVKACGGFCCLKEKPMANMIWGMVHRSEHGKGLGKRLFLHRMQQIKTLFPQHSISLDTSQHTFEFFQKFGFAVTTITPNGYGPGLDRYDMVKTETR